MKNQTAITLVAGIGLPLALSQARDSGNFPTESHQTHHRQALASDSRQDTCPCVW